MKRIDRETRQRIIDAADIVEVVSDYVSLKRRGQNYIGLCPFHNERTPSFSVSPSRGICHCFGCGKGGTPVNFIMELEHMTFTEALLHLAKKYNIEVPDREMTSQEVEAENHRQALMAANEFGLAHFEERLENSDEGRNIGLAYLLERGVSPQMIKRFHLGYSLDSFDDLINHARSKGYPLENLIEVGLIGKSQQGKDYDRFRGRVIFPVFSVSGRVVAFGGRRLSDAKKEVAKYINSPESEIYSKRRELYGLYQSRAAIRREDSVILVEGYLDVISLHQSGVENVVASSGTSLTIQQIEQLRRLTRNVTVVYDTDAAGIKASLRGIDMLLSSGMTVHVLQFPDGDDPDSYSQTHTADEVKQYMTEHRVDFITFKTGILMHDVRPNDPTARATVINEIINTVALIGDDVTRSLYCETLSQQLSVPEQVVRARVKAVRSSAQVDEVRRKQIESEHEKIQPDEDKPVTDREQPADTKAKTLRPFELQLLRYAVRYGMVPMCELMDEQGNPAGEMSVIEYINEALVDDGLTFINQDVLSTYDRALQYAADPEWPEIMAKADESINREIERKRREGIEKIAATATDGATINKEEKLLNETLLVEAETMRDDFRSLYLGKLLMNEDDDVIRILSTDLVSEKYQLSKIHTKYMRVETERERCRALVERSLCELKDAVLQLQIDDLKKRLVAEREQGNDHILSLMEEIQALMNTKKEFSPWIGDRVLQPFSLVRSPRMRRR